MRAPSERYRESRRERESSCLQEEKYEIADRLRQLKSVFSPFGAALRYNLLAAPPQAQPALQE
jgi:hypothetical protein